MIVLGGSGPFFQASGKRNKGLRISCSKRYGETGLRYGAGRDFESCVVSCECCFFFFFFPSLEEHGLCLTSVPFHRYNKTFCATFYEIGIESEIISFITHYISLCLTSFHTF